MHLLNIKVNTRLLYNWNYRECCNNQPGSLVLWSLAKLDLTINNQLTLQIESKLVSLLGQTTVFVGSIFSILILTSNLDTVYPGSPKNTFRLKKFQDLVPQIAPWSFSKIFEKNVALSSTGPKTLKYHRIFKCHTISESYWIALWDRVMKSGVTWSTNEKGAFEDWKLKPP